MEARDRQTVSSCHDAQGPFRLVLGVAEDHTGTEEGVGDMRILQGDVSCGV